MDDLDYHLLAWLEDGHSVFRPAERTEASRQEFQRISDDELLACDVEQESRESPVDPPR
jgi:hypothetical protein